LIDVDGLKKKKGKRKKLFFVFSNSFQEKRKKETKKRSRMQSPFTNSLNICSTQLNSFSLTRKIFQKNFNKSREVKILLIEF